MDDLPSILWLATFMFMIGWSAGILMACWAMGLNTTKQRG